MKRLLIMAFAIVPLLAMAQDDLYFTSSKKPKEQTPTAYMQKKSQEEVARMQARSQSMAARVEATEPPAVVDYHSNNRSEDEYNRRYVYSGDYQNAGGRYADSLAASVDTVGGYYASEYDLDDPELDYRFSRRLVRFHNPRLYALASPYYWDLYYGYGAWDYLYDPYYDPWYYHYGWHYGWTWGPWDCWYGSIWGWHSPYAWSYWGWGPGWHHPPMHGGFWHGGVHNNVPRQWNSARGHMAAGNRLRTNPSGRTTLASRSNIVGGSRLDASRSRTNPISGRSRDIESRSTWQDRSRTSATQRSSATTRTNPQTPSRSDNNRTSSSRSSSNSNYTTPSRSSSFSNGSSRSSSGSGFGGGSRSGSSFGGGGGSRGGGGRR